MAELLWGKVFYGDQFAGFLREEPGDRVTFAYDESYLNAGYPAIAHTLPLRGEPFVNQSGLHPFFDNLVAEGWLEEAQLRLLGKRQARRFELLLAFGQDCAGAVSVIDPDPARLHQNRIDMSDPKEVAVLASRASLSGVQPKLMLTEQDGKLRPAHTGELSTHIAKFPSLHHLDLVANEYLTTLAFKALLPNDNVVDLWISEIEGFSEPALIIKRFDRANGARIHFEEFNQLLARPSQAKYDGAHIDMADFISQTPGCLPAENYRLYTRILAGLLLGNTDMHLKNFAMFHTADGLRLTPTYDMVSATIYNYKTVALAIYGSANMQLGNLKPNNLILLGQEFGLSPAAIKLAYDQLAANMDAAKEAVLFASFGAQPLKDQIIDVMEKRWNGTFSLIGQTLLQKQ